MAGDERPLLDRMVMSDIDPKRTSGQRRKRLTLGHAPLFTRRQRCTAKSHPKLLAGRSLKEADRARGRANDLTISHAAEITSIGIVDS